ncbi:HIT family protein [Mucilaginibacter sp. HD30]
MSNQRASASKPKELLYPVVDTRCAFCTIVKNESNETWVTDMEYGSIFLNYNQSFYGRLLYVPFNHYSTIQEIPVDQYVEYCIELRILGSVLQDEMKAELVNYAMLANKVKHVHWHLIPRYKSDERWGEAPWPNNSKSLDEKEVWILREKIRTSLLKS